MLKLEGGQVTFRYKDYADAHQHKTLTLDAVEFMRRFVQHVLAKGFVKVRHCGLLANNYREDKLQQCRRLLLPLGWATAAGEEAGVDPVREQCCAQCGSRRLLRVCAVTRGALPITVAGHTS